MNTQKLIILCLSACFLILTACDDSSENSDKKIVPGEFSIQYSGTETGNGGGAVVCRDANNQIQTVEVLDLYEAKVLRGLTPDIGSSTDKFSLKVEAVLLELEKVSPIRAKKYRSIYNQFFKEAVMVPDANLVYIDDAANIVLPQDCKKEQASILRTPEFPGDARYVISKLLWDKMDENSKAALVLHEIMYQEGLFWQHRNSKPTRFLVGLITSNEMKKMTAEKFAEIILASDFRAVDLFGTLVTKQVSDNNNTISYSNWNLSDFEFFEGFIPKKTQYNEYTLSDSLILSFSRETRKLTVASGIIEIQKPGLHIKSTRNFSVSLKDDKIKTLTQNRSGALSAEFTNWSLKLDGGEFCCDLYFDEDELPQRFGGNIHTANPAINYKSPVMYSRGDFRWPRTLTKKGVILEAELVEDSIVMTPQGPLKFTSKSNSMFIWRLIFDENGVVKSGMLAPNQQIVTKYSTRKSSSPLSIEFLDDGKAKVYDGYYSESPDNVIDGCEIKNIENLLYSNIKVALKSTFKDTDWDSNSLKVVKQEDYVDPDVHYPKSLPSYNVTFNAKDGSLISLESNKYEYGGSESLGGFVLHEDAVLRQERNNLGIVTRRYCEQYSFGLSDKYTFFNITLNVKTSSTYLYIKSLVEEPPLK